MSDQGGKGRALDTEGVVHEQEWRADGDPQAIRAAMARTREDLRDAWGEVQEAVTGRLDLAHRFEREPMVFVGAVFVAGVVIGLLGGSER